MLLLGEDVPLSRVQTPPGDGFWYLATPYTKYPEGPEAAFREACRIAGWLIMQKVPVFCPIAHTHPIAEYGNLPLVDYKLWLGADTPFMSLAQGIIIAGMPTWDTSYGISVERMEFASQGKPEYFLPREMWEGGR